MSKENVIKNAGPFLPIIEMQDPLFRVKLEIFDQYIKSKKNKKKKK